MKIASFFLIVLSGMALAEPKPSIHGNTGKKILVGVGLSGYTKKLGMKWTPVSIFDFTGMLPQTLTPRS